MAGVNKVILVGNLGADPEVRTLENGVKVARINLATTEVFRDRNGERRELTEWHNVTLWRGLAEISEKYLSKGRQVYVEGKLKTRKWTDSENRDRYTTEVIADQLQMLGRAPSSQDGDSNYAKEPAEQSSQPAPSSSKPSASTAQGTNAASEPEDDLPF